MPDRPRDPADTKPEEDDYDPLGVRSKPAASPTPPPAAANKPPVKSRPLVPKAPLTPPPAPASHPPASPALPPESRRDTPPPVNMSGGRASDMLRQGLEAGKAIPGVKTTPGSSGLGDLSGVKEVTEAKVDRRATRFDDMAQAVFWLSALIFVAGLAWLLWGTWGGEFTNPTFSSLAHADKVRFLHNIDIVSLAMKCALIIGTAAYLFLFYHEEVAGYVMVAVGLVLQLGLSYVTTLVYHQTGAKPTFATNQIFNYFSFLSWIVLVPGGALIVWDIFQRIVGGLSSARTKRATMQYGRTAVKDKKPQNVLLGPCWKLPYCVSAVRERCPIFLQKKGPCWRHKRGCQCDQDIIQLAQSPDWKQKVNATLGSPGHKSSLPLPPSAPQPQLSMAAKKERCRQCVIYNTHQEHKYKVLVGLTFAAVFVGIGLFYNELYALTNNLFFAAYTLTKGFELVSVNGMTYHGQVPGVVIWSVMGVLGLVALSKLLQLVEYCCFQIKI